MKKIYTILLLMLIVVTSVTFSQVPRIINYQGLLVAPEGQTFPEGQYDLTFSLYNEPGDLLWTETHQQVFITGGMFQVHLGSVVPLELPFNQGYFLGIRVNNDPEMEPRMSLTSAAYSLMSASTESLEGFRLSEVPMPYHILPLDSTGMFPSNVIPSGGTNGDYLRKNSPDSSKGNFNTDVLKIHNFGMGRGLTVISDSSHGVYSKSNSDMPGVEGVGAGNGPGVRGYSQNNYGVIGTTGATDKAGIYGKSDYIGVFGEANISSSSTAVLGLSTYGEGVRGVTSFGNTGIIGRSLASGHGVEGRSVGGDGILGSTDNSTKSGVFGTSTLGTGVTGRSIDNNGISGSTESSTKSGVFGSSTAGIGVAGRSENNDGILAVTASNQTGKSALRARNEGTGPAIISEGDIVVNGGFKGNKGSIGGAPFPKPAFDTGWVTVLEDDCATFIVDVGGNNLDYFIYPQRLSASGQLDNLYEGSSWGYALRVSDNTLWICSYENNDNDKFRVRIWVY